MTVPLRLMEIFSGCWRAPAGKASPVLQGWKSAPSYSDIFPSAPRIQTTVRPAGGPPKTATRLCAKVGAQIKQRVRGRSRDRMQVVLSQISFRFRIVPRFGALSRSDARSNALRMQQSAGAPQTTPQLRFDFAITGVNPVWIFKRIQKCRSRLSQGSRAKRFTPCVQTLRPRRFLLSCHRYGLCHALLDGNKVTRRVSGVDLPRTRNLLLRILQHFLPLRQPAHRPRNGEQHREQVRFEAQRLVDDPAVKINVRIQLPLDEVFVLQS